MAITIEDLQALRSQVEETRKQLQEQEHALEVVERMVLAMQPKSAPPANHTLGAWRKGIVPVTSTVLHMHNGEITKHPSLASEVRRVIKSFQGKPFTRPAIDAALSETSSLPSERLAPSSIAAALTVLGRTGEILLIEPGNGNTPHTYVAGGNLAQGDLNAE